MHVYLLTHLYVFLFHPQNHTLDIYFQFMITIIISHIGLVTCIAFCPNTEHVILVGVDTGALYQCSIVCSVHTLVRYSAHTSPVRGLAWNSHHSQIFLSCSVDWTVKVWLQHKMYVYKFL